MGPATYQRDGDPRTSGPGFGLTFHADASDLPLRWSGARTVFANSMSDLLHLQVPDAFIAKVLEVITATPQRTYQLLTKRSRRLAALDSGVPGRPTSG